MDRIENSVEDLWRTQARVYSFNLLWTNLHLHWPVYGYSLLTLEALEQCVPI